MKGDEKMIGGISGSPWFYYGYGSAISGSPVSGNDMSGVSMMGTSAQRIGGKEDDGVILELSDEGKKAGRGVNNASASEECQTCKNRKYVDGSDENVSFKSAAHISPEAAASRVMAHEQKHVSNAYVKAEKMDGKVVSASVSIHTEICPECGKSFVAGGQTNTMIKYGNEQNPYQQQKKSIDAISLVGRNVDYVA